MSYMFDSCLKLTKITDISNWNTSKVTNMEHMFYKCNPNLNYPDISKWDMNKVTNKKNMLSSSGSVIKNSISFFSGIFKK